MEENQNYWRIECLCEMHIYSSTDKTAKPNVVYYYRIEDVSFDGVQQTLTTVRLKGDISATGKLTTR